MTGAVKRAQGAPATRAVRIRRGEVVADFPSVGAAAEALGVSDAALHQAARRRGKCLGFSVRKLGLLPIWEGGGS